MQPDATALGHLSQVISDATAPAFLLGAVARFVAILMLAAILATILAIHLGFTLVVVVAVILYVAAATASERPESCPTEDEETAAKCRRAPGRATRFLDWQPNPASAQIVRALRALDVEDGLDEGRLSEVRNEHRLSSDDRAGAVTPVTTATQVLGGAWQTAAGQVPPM
jgi:hypothetical protein